MFVIYLKYFRIHREFNIQMIKKENRRNGYQLDPQKELNAFRGDSEARFKTEMCRNWDNGDCEYGDKCFFAHGQHELREKNPAKLVKDQKCENFFKAGYCINGSKCIYSHSEDIREKFTNGKKNIQGNAGEKLNPPIFVDLESRNPYRA